MEVARNGKIATYSDRAGLWVQTTFPAYEKRHSDIFITFHFALLWKYFRGEPAD